MVLPAWLPTADALPLPVPVDAGKSSDDVVGAGGVSADAASGMCAGGAMIPSRARNKRRREERRGGREAKRRTSGGKKKLGQDVWD